MAEYAMRSLLEKERPGKTKVMSAGIAAASGYPATLYAIEAAKIWDLNVVPHRSQMLTEKLINSADLIFTMSSEHSREVINMVPEAENKTYLLKNFPEAGVMGESVEDPIGQSLEQYNETFLEIGEYLGKHLPEILNLIDRRQYA